MVVSVRMTAMRIPSLLFAAVVALSACGGDDKTSPTETPGDGTTSPTGLNIAVDSQFAVRTAVVGSTLPAGVHVTQNGAGVPNITVTWIVLAGNGTTASQSSTTDASGAATTTWTIGDTVRVNTLQATITGASATMQVNPTAGPAVGIAKASPDSSAVVAGASVLLGVRAVDKSGNSVSGITINWASPLGSLGASTTITGPSGRAEVSFTTTPTPGTYTVTASGAGLGSTSFKVVGL